MKKYIGPEMEIISVNALDIILTSIQGNGSDPYRSAEDWRDAIDEIER